MRLTRRIRPAKAKVIRYETGGVKPGGFGRFTFIADKGYGGSQQMCDDIISDSIARAFPNNTLFDKLFMNCTPSELVDAPWKRGDFAAIDAGSATRSPSPSALITMALSVPIAAGRAINAARPWPLTPPFIQT